MGLDRVYDFVQKPWAEKQRLVSPDLIWRIHDTAKVTSNKDIASCLGVICLKHIDVRT